jgi:mgtE-like transporter
MSQQRAQQKGSRLTAPLRWMGWLARAFLGPPARAVRGTARRVADPARQVVAYWASERLTMRQAFVAIMVASVTSLGAGVTLAEMDARLEEVEGLFVLIPVSIGMRGNIFGALAARLGTSIHVGLFEVTRSRTGTLYQNVYAAILLTIGTAVAMGLLARGIAGLMRIDTVTVWDLILIALIGGVLSSTIVLGVTVVLSAASFRRGWDLDSVAAPLITAAGDVVTLPCLLLASFVYGNAWVSTISGVTAVVLGAAALIRGWTSTLPVARRIVRESFPVLCIAIVLDILAGTVVEPRIDDIFIPMPAFLILLPGFLEKTGSLGGILAARLGSKLHLGVVTPNARPEAAALLDGTLILALGLTVFAITAATTLGIAEILDQAYPGALRFTGIVLLGGLLATLLAGIIGYYAAIAAYRFGLDPDNHTIPLVTSGMDLLGVICLVAAIVVFGVA